MQLSPVRAVLRVTLFLLVTAILVPPYLMAMLIHHRPARLIAQIWFSAVCRFAGLRVTATGTPSRHHPVLYVSNHVSYLDIPVLGSLIDAIFVAKAEVAQWPLFGFLARIARTIFIQRTAVHAARQRERLARQLAHDNLILFPEGTSSNGRDVLPFKSALFSVAKHGPGPSGITVQPVSVAYVADLDGRPLDGERQDCYAWHGDMTLVPHLKRVFMLPGAEVQVTFHPVVDAEDFETRKALARHCEIVVAHGVTESHGRQHAQAAA